MKKLFKILSLVLVTAMLSSCSAVKKPKNTNFPTFEQSKEEKVNKLSLEIFSHILEKVKDENLIVSPLSIQKSIEVIAKLNTDKTGLDFLNNYTDFSLQNLDFENTKIDNLILINKKVLGDKTVKKTDFENVKVLKDAEKMTKEYKDFQKDFFDKVLDDKKIEDDVFISIIDAIKYNSKWDNPFSEKLTSKKEFTLSNGEKIEVDTMFNQFENSKAINDDEKEIFSLKSKDSTVYFIKTKNNAKLTADKFYPYINELGKVNSNKVHFSLPKIDTKVEINFKHLFEDLKLNLLLENFDMNKLIQNSPLRISSARQVSTLKLDEKGAKAESITKIDLKESAAPTPKQEEPIKINMDSPFYIVIMDKDTKSNSNLITFCSYISNPSK